MGDQPVPACERDWLDHQRLSSRAWDASRSPANWHWVSDPNIYTNALYSYDMGVPVVEGQVLKVTFHAKWSSDPAIGFMEVFLNNGSGWVTGFPK